MIEKKVLRINKDLVLSQVELRTYLVFLKLLVSKVDNSDPYLVQYPIIPKTKRPFLEKQPFCKNMILKLFFNKSF
jgi:hypothetical protein